MSRVRQDLQKIPLVPLAFWPRAGVHVRQGSAPQFSVPCSFDNRLFKKLFPAQHTAFLFSLLRTQGNAIFAITTIKILSNRFLVKSLTCYYNVVLVGKLDSFLSTPISLSRNVAHSWRK